MRIRLVGRLGVAATAAVCLGAAVSCRQTAPEISGTSDAVGVSVQAVRRDTLRDVANVAGRVVPSTAADVTVWAPEAAEVVELPKKEQDTVAVGDLLVRFEIPSITQEIAARQLLVSQAQQYAEEARTEAAKQDALFARGLVARNAYEASQVEQSTAEAELGQATADLELAKTDEARAVVRARFAGVVLQVWHAEGDHIRGGPDDPVLRVIDPSRVQVAVQLPVAQLARVAPGQTATVRAIAGSTDEAATVVRKIPITDPTVATGEVRLAFDGDATLPLDTPVSVEILLDQRTNAIVVPVAALLRDNGSPYVMVAGDDGLAHRRNVRLGLVTRDFAQVLDGVTVGEQIVLGGVNDIEDGTPITFRTD